MKRIATAALAAAAALSSCGMSGKSPEDYISADDLVIYQSTTAPDEENATVPFVTTSPAEANKKQLSYALNGNSVELSIDNEIVSSFGYYYTPDMTKIAIADYDFDGYDDIFIPYEYPTDYGYYYCYYPEKNQFVQNAELSNLGKLLTVSETEENTLIRVENDGYKERTYEYKWEGSKLLLTRRIDKYQSAVDNLIHTDVTRYDSKGNEIPDESN